MNGEKEKLYADELVANAVNASLAFENYDQEKVDRIVEAVYRAAFDARIEMANRAIEETFLGNLEDKVKKNVFASLIVFRDIKDKKTVGIISEDPDSGIIEVAQPLGPILNMTPITNPTATVVNKALICLKTRNPVIFAPHKAAKKCSRLAAKICYEAAVDAGAPQNAIQWTSKSKWSYTEALMQHHDIGLVIATTAFHFVKEAYKSGNPCLGAGEGNVPVYVDKSADLKLAARSIVQSKTFDNSTVCCSEQTVVVHNEIACNMHDALIEEGAYFCNKDEAEKLGKAVFDPERRLMRSDVVGKPATYIAERAGITVPEGTKLLIGEIESVGVKEPLSHEILAPVLSYYVAKDFDDAVSFVFSINRHHGKGHTLSLYTKDDEQIKFFAGRIKSGRIILDTPSSLGGLGGTFNRIHPSLTLSCGAGGGQLYKR